jgi:opacity protein-like surface antigen
MWRVFVICVLLMAGPVARATDTQWFFAPRLLAAYVDTNDSASDFDRTESVDLQGGYSINDWLALTGGLAWYDDSQESGETDAGQYELTLSTYSLYLGAQAAWQLSPQWSFNVDAGIDYAHVELDVEEGFRGIKPRGKDSIDDRVPGFHASIGARYKIGNISAGPVFSYRRAPDVFDDDSNYPFDLILKSLGVELLWPL